ncbi:MAG: VOC family protein [Nitrobacter sp.]|nr:VOC family protein [Nitrobacter sp.]
MTSMDKPSADAVICMSRRIDHVVVAVHDLDAAGAFYQRLGFQVGGRNHHPWGTENRLIQFNNAFIELIAVGSFPIIRLGGSASVHSSATIFVAARVWRCWRWIARMRKPTRRCLPTKESDDSNRSSSNEKPGVLMEVKPMLRSRLPLPAAIMLRNAASLFVNSTSRNISGIRNSNPIIMER